MKLNSLEARKALYEYPIKNYGEHMAIQILLSKYATEADLGIVSCVLSTDYEIIVTPIMVRIIKELNIEISDANNIL